MFKIFTVIASMFIITAPAVASQSSCLMGIAEAKGWTGLTSEQLECIGRSDDGTASLANLCSSNQEDFSPSYKAYRGYEVSYKEAFRAFQTATDALTRSQAQMEMAQIDRDWKLSGYKREVAAMLEALSRAKPTCEGR